MGIKYPLDLWIKAWYSLLIKLLNIFIILYFNIFNYLFTLIWVLKSWSNYFQTIIQRASNFALRIFLFKIPSFVVRIFLGVFNCINLWIRNVFLIVFIIILLIIFIVNHFSSFWIRRKRIHLRKRRNRLCVFRWFYIIPIDWALLPLVCLD